MTVANVVRWLIAALLVLAHTGAPCLAQNRRNVTPIHPPAPTDGVDLAKDKTLYAVGYSHLDTQWRWDFETTIRHYIPATLRDNFELFKKYPEYVFNFTGSFRYQLMQEYYPDLFEELKTHVAKGRWHIVGSSVDEGDVNVPSPESLVRQILYGNDYFRSVFRREPVDFMLPDCFGFPASLPTIFAHCGLKGFVTQKLTWGSAVGIPFNVGVWEGTDGRGIIAALNPGPYVTQVRQDMTQHPTWVRRINELGEAAGVYTDYFFFGTGDRGGAPDEQSVDWMTKSARAKGPIRVALTSSDQLFRDLTPEQIRRLPRYKGDLLLTEHSAGTLTSQAYMKRWNRKNELLADAAERASVASWLLTGAPYPGRKLELAWTRVLANQMHDIIPGTSIPKAYEYSWNDEVLALNGFAECLTYAAGGVARALNTDVLSDPIVLFNPLSIARRDVVEATVPFTGEAPQNYFVMDTSGADVPCQILEQSANATKIAFLAQLPPVGFAVYELQPTYGAPKAAESSLSISSSHLENERYRVEIDGAGDIAQITDKKHQRPLLSAPAGLVFLRDAPAQYPAWNMDWKDLQAAPYARVDGPAEIRILEQGPARVALEIIREAQGSRFRQVLSLAQGGATLEVDNVVEWYTQGACLKADFPLAVANDKATYNWGAGTIERPTNHSKQYEVPSHQWIDLTDRDGSYGVSILEDCKYGSDKPSENQLRLTLLRTPECKSYADQATQDLGVHEFKYAILGHAGDWRQGESHWHGARLNQPPLAFHAPKRPGVGIDRTYSFVQVEKQPDGSQPIAIRAIKKAESGTQVIVRLQELHGREYKNVRVRFRQPVTVAREVDGQERYMGNARVEDGVLVCDFSPYRLQAFAVTLQPSRRSLPRRNKVVNLPLNCDVISSNDERSDGDFDGKGNTLPAEQLPPRMMTEGILFEFASLGAGEDNAVACRGQKIQLRQASGGRVCMLVAASEDTVGSFQVDSLPPVERKIPAWNGYLGQWDNRVWRNEHVVRIEPGYIKRAPWAWFASHYHSPEEDKPYQFCYLFKVEIDVAPESRVLTLPDNDKIKILAMTVNVDEREAEPAQPLYDTLDLPRAVSRPRLLGDIAFSSGLFLDSTKIALTSDTAGAEVRYTLDGTTPTPSSSLYEGPIAVSADTTLKARAYRVGMPPSLELEQQLRKTTATPAVALLTPKPGLRFEYYEATGLSRLPDFDGLAPKDTGTSLTVSIDHRARDDDFAFRFRGYFHAPQRGVYRFTLSSDDGSRLYLSKKLLIDHDGLHGASERRGVAALEAGYHPIEIQHFERGGDEVLRVEVEGPGVPRGPLPGKTLFHAGS